MARLVPLLLLMVLWVATSAAAPLAPPSLTVPMTDPDGGYTASWLPSATSGATYTLEESTRSDFSLSLRQAYVGTRTKVSIKGVRAGSTYYYRVKATLNGENSGWTTSAGCDVPVIVKVKSGKGGSVAPLGIVTIPVGEAEVFSVVPSEGYHTTSVKVDGVELGAVDQVVSTNLVIGPKNKHSITAKFTINKYTVTAGAGPGGKITPAGEKVYKHGKPAKYTITPNVGHVIDCVLINGVRWQGVPPTGPCELPLAVNEPTDITVSFIPTGCLDSDGDGYFAGSAACGQVDCNDASATTHPGALEICGDGIDQDCSGNDLICPAQSIQIGSLDRTSAPPAGLLTIHGTGFDPTAILSVHFSGGNGYSLIVPAVMVTSTAVTVIVPPLIDMSTGESASATVNIQLIEGTGPTPRLSPPFAGFVIESLPISTLPPGEITANVAGFLELTFANSISRMESLGSSSGGQVDTDALRADLEALRAQFAQLKNKVRAIAGNPGATEHLGAINGLPVIISQQSLQIADRWTLAILSEIKRQLDSAAVQTFDSAVLSRSLAQPTCNDDPAICKDLMSTYVLSPLMGERAGEQASSQHYLQIQVPAARDILADISKKFGAVTATIGVAVTTAGGSLPLSVVGALTTANTVGMTAVFGMDAAALANNSADREAAKRLLDDFNGYLGVMRDVVISPVLSAFSQKAGSLYDLYTGWEPVLGDKFSTYLSQLKNYIDVGPPTCTFFAYSAWSACQPGNTQTRSIISSSPPGCTGGNPVVEQGCVPVCCACYFDVYCSVPYGPGGCWYCNNSTYVGDVCQAPSGYLTMDGSCVCEPELIEVCR